MSAMQVIYIRHIIFIILMIKDRLQVAHAQGEHLVGPGLRYSASAALLAWGVSRIVLVTAWTSGVVIGTANPFIRALQYLIMVSMGVPSIAFALSVAQAPSVTRKHLALGGSLLLAVGIGNGFIELTRLLTFPYPELVYTSLSFYSGLARNILLIYLGFRLLRDGLVMGRTTFTALALLAVAALLRVVDLGHLFNVLLSGGLNVLWPSHLLYAVSMGLAFVTFVLAGRSTPVDLENVTRRREYMLFRGAILVYGLHLLYNFVIIYLLQFDEYIANMAVGAYGSPYYIVTVYLWPFLDVLFALAVISVAGFVKQLAPPAGALADVVV